MLALSLAMLAAACAQPAPLPPAPAPPPNCHDDTAGPNADLLYLGQIGGPPQLPAYKNVQASSSTNGTCSSPVNVDVTAVEAPDHTTANVYCNAALSGGVGTNAVAFGYATMAANLYLCLGGPGLGDELLETGRCYEGADDTIPDIKFLGPRNTLDNGFFSASFDGSCSAPGRTLTLVQHSTQGFAGLVCNEINNGLAALGLNSVLNEERYPDAPADIWACL